MHHRLSHVLIDPYPLVVLLYPSSVVEGGNKQLRLIADGNHQFDLFDPRFLFGMTIVTITIKNNMKLDDGTYIHQKIMSVSAIFCFINGVRLVLLWLKIIHPFIPVQLPTLDKRGNNGSNQTVKLIMLLSIHYIRPLMRCVYRLEICHWILLEYNSKEM